MREEGSRGFIRDGRGARNHLPAVSETKPSGLHLAHGRHPAARASSLVSKNTMFFLRGVLALQDGRQ